MVKKRFLLPWQRKCIIVCPKCGGRIETRPLWFWEKQEDKLDKLQLQFCHVIDLVFLEKIPVLSENDWKSKQKWDAMWKDLTDDFGQMRPYEELSQNMYMIEDGLPRIFLKYGIFALILFLTERELEMLFLFIYLQPDKFLVQVWLKQIMQISRSYVSIILKKLKKWRLIEAWTTQVKGRARGRQLAYKLSGDAHRILEEDLRNSTFFRNAVIETAVPIAERFPLVSWREDLLNTC